jgi:hypothetical protein
LLLIAAFLQWRKEQDPDDPPPKWMTSMSSRSTLKALGASALFVTIAVKQWVFTLTAIDAIAGAGLNGSANVGLYLFYTIATQALVLIPIVAYAVAPKQAAKPMQAAQAWLARHNRVIAISVSLIFGLRVLYKGITGLLG